MTPEQKALFATLLKSLKEGINATLTPNDSRILLEMLKDTPVVRGAIPHGHRKAPAPAPFIARFHATANLVMDTIEELAGDIEEICGEMKRK